MLGRANRAFHSSPAGPHPSPFTEEEEGKTGAQPKPVVRQEFGTSDGRVRARYQDGTVHGLDVGVAAKGHGDVQLLADDFQRFGHAGLAISAQAIQEGAADVAAARAQRPGLEHD